MTVLRASGYNVRAEAADGTVVYANTRSGAVAAVGPDVDAVLDPARHAGGADALEPGWCDALVRAGLLVGVGDDEVHDVRRRYAHDREAADLQLTISPTVACNLRCTYCFEAGHPTRYLDRDEQDAVMTLVRRRLDEGARSFQVTWFGGEPLLHLAGLTALSRRFVRLAAFRGVPYAASIITNGTLLTPEVAATLRRHRVTHAQISLDGPQVTHDQLRVDARRRGSYERVVAGIGAALGHLAVTLRIHVDRSNVRHVAGLLHDLADRGLTGVVPRFVRIEPPAAYRAAAEGAVPVRFLTVAEFAEAEVGWIEEAVGLGFAAHAPLDVADVMLPCAAVHRGHLAIEPGSRVKRCWIDVADDTHASGTLRADGTVVLGAGDEVWRRYAPFDLGCDSCAFLPACMGGCPKTRLGGLLASDLPEAEKRRFKESYVCTPRKHNLAALLARGLVR